MISTAFLASSLWRGGVYWTLVDMALCVAKRGWMGRANSGSVLTVMPVLIIFVVMQKTYLEAIMIGRVNG